MEINGKVAFITGAASGIGRATARRLAKDGAAIAVADLDGEAAKAMALELSRNGAKALALAVDVTDANQMKSALSRAMDELGRLDIVHNNAGIGLTPPGFPQGPLAEWRRVLDIDLQAVILGCYLSAPILEQQGGGVIINTASMAGLYPHPTDPIYGAAKAGVVWFTYALASWAQQRKIRVNAVCPGIVDTPLVQRGQRARAAAGLSTLAPTKMLRPEQIADGVAMLIADDSLFGRALEIRPSGGRVLETPRMPGQKA